MTDPLAQALCRIEELERAVATFEAMNPDLFEMMAQVNSLRAQRDGAIVDRDAGQSSIRRANEKIYGLLDQLKFAERTIETMKGARNEYELRAMYERYRSNDPDHDSRRAAHLRDPHYTSPRMPSHWMESTAPFPGYRK